MNNNSLKIFVSSNSKWDELTETAQPLATVEIKNAHSFLRLCETCTEDKDMIRWCFSKSQTIEWIKIKRIKKFPVRKCAPNDTCFIAFFHGLAMRWRFGADIAEVATEPTFSDMVLKPQLVDEEI